MASLGYSLLKLKQNSDLEQKLKSIYTINHLLYYTAVMQSSRRAHGRKSSPSQMARSFC